MCTSAPLRRRAALLALSLSLLACQSAPSGPPEAPGVARRYPGYGGYHRAASHATPEAQEWMDQGWQLVYGFNHDEAIRSFHEAARLAPECPMAWWGIAYANGIDVNNAEMKDEANRAAWAASREALRLASTADPVERSLIEAVGERYAWPAPENRRPLDEAYAAAMGRAFAVHPEDPDVAALYAESLMLLQPWDYWSADGEPRGRAEEIVAVLEHAISVAPLHPGANHFYIHAVEASRDPARAEAIADRLGNLVPGSGHLVHMPSHIYVNVGRYEDAVAANERAIKADEAYFAIAPPPRFYRLYFLHNVHFLAFAAMMEANYETAMNAARRVATGMPPEALEELLSFADGLMTVDLHTLIRFGRWEDVLAMPEYPQERKASRAMRHYARTVALANLERVPEARAELGAYDAAAAEVPETWVIGVNPAAKVLAVARGMAEGEVLWREGHTEEAYDELRKAVRLEDELAYDEPPGWMQPVRHALGALLLAGDSPEEALEVYRIDLADNPGNAWSMLGLDQALRAQGRIAEAEALAPQLAAAWAHADVDPPASCYCGVRP